jgi:glyoxylase-like metal-dependent hydrolase (beta-lactamase superfamily II)
MFNWARPPVEMTTKVFLGEPCKVDRYTEEYQFEGDIAPLLLSGHTMGHTGFLCNGVLFAGDALYPKATWERHKLPYSIDVELTRRSLDVIKKTTFDWLVPSHSAVMSKEESVEQIALRTACTDRCYDTATFRACSINGRPHLRRAQRA